MISNIRFDSLNSRKGLDDRPAHNTCHKYTMRWDIKSIEKLIEEYNTKYFKGKIKSKILIKWSRKYYTQNGAEATLSTQANRNTYY